MVSISEKLNSHSPKYKKRDILIDLLVIDKCTMGPKDLSQNQAGLIIVPNLLCNWSEVDHWNKKADRKQKSTSKKTKLLSYKTK